MAILPFFQKNFDKFDERVGSQLQQAIAAVLDEINVNRRPQLSSELLDPVALTSGTTKLVQHKLGRAVRGFKVVDINAAAHVFRDSSSTADLTKYLPVQANANCTVTLEVF